MGKFPLPAARGASRILMQQAANAIDGSPSRYRLLLLLLLTAVLLTWIKSFNQTVIFDFKNSPHLVTEKQGSY